MFTPQNKSFSYLAYVAEDFNATVAAEGLIDGAYVINVIFLTYFYSSKKSSENKVRNMVDLEKITVNSIKSTLNKLISLSH